MVPFTISAPQDALDAVRQRVESAVLPPPAPSSNSPWTYGVPNADISRIVDYWKTSYDWRKAEAELNAELPQFTLPVAVQGHETLQAHFVHKRALAEPGRKVIPLLFIHGWPGHFCEVRRILPMLVDPKGDGEVAFDVVAPSLPGFGYSNAPEKSGFALRQYAEFCHNLMLGLGYDKYVVQGGDWGFFIAQRIIHFYGPTHVKGWHTNFPVTGPPTLVTFPRLYLTSKLTSYTAQEKKGLERSEWFATHGQGYIGVQSTMPQTLAYALTDSPVGLLA
ncbi:epoxide hydrolase [Phanerochaete sordida]|uniref:Epoxide hydrolase n=1 Tax=Phanerochaete sordida TaxID=48140 RepID=A0A9P3GDJ9_9APHY|nr:epoxide hydrolase [Phanerochaete sordida]